LQLEIDVLIGAVKNSFIVNLDVIEKAIAISEEIINNLDADMITY